MPHVALSCLNLLPLIRLERLSPLLPLALIATARKLLVLPEQIQPSHHVRTTDRPVLWDDVPLLLGRGLPLGRRRVGRLAAEFESEELQGLLYRLFFWYMFVDL